MNRRSFTALLASLPLTYSLTGRLSAAVASQTASVPAGTYAWAQLIARAQNRCSPAILARQLHLSPDAATALFNEMLRDGVLRAPGAAGIAQAARPLQTTGAEVSGLRPHLSRLRQLLHKDPSTPLVKAPEPRLGCDDVQPEENADARETEPLQESPQER